ncbi:AMP deaminase [Planoprotostelium fungivorum]|uniref:AMP deaminase n=1 Tax=Planoprotostelium fungivorum TaxID=1890364 RepID=A0A2P6NR65_9EUKA|nr:AMP deaminase [Planoprotostelium fungivorum]
MTDTDSPSSARFNIQDSSDVNLRSSLNPIFARNHRLVPRTAEGEEIDTNAAIQLGKEVQEASKLILSALELRKKYNPDLESYQSSQKPQDGELAGVKYECRAGTFVAVKDGADAYEAPLSFKQYVEDYNSVLHTVSYGPVKSLTYKRLKFLESKFNFHKLLNADRELLASKLDTKDFTNIIKVDTHVHLAAAMTARHLLHFIKRKARLNPDDEVILNRDGSKQILSKVFESLHLRPEELTVNSLDVFADNTFQRFDNFNNKYNPFGFSELRTVFLKTDNYIKGQYFAEITRELLEQMEKNGYERAEYRLSIYGRSKQEWTDLAQWVETFQLNSKVNRWIIQIPRIYEVFRKMNAVKSFGQVIENIFEPLFAVTLNPASNPVLFRFLQRVSGFDSVDDESKPEAKLLPGSTTDDPLSWTETTNPPYAYYLYYMWSNITSLNRLRMMRNYNIFHLRPHSGESGDVDHLASSFLVARGINHGINLERNTPLQYLFYLSQIGLAVSPLSNNALFLDYKRNPFPLFLKRGLNVSLSTDDPLVSAHRTWNTDCKLEQFHLTQDPLMEEYAIAAKRWRFSECDLAEIAKNSVIQSGFTRKEKEQWLGPNFLKSGVAGNDSQFSNLPNIRASFREENLAAEFADLRNYASKLQIYAPIVIQFDYPTQIPTVQVEEVEACQLLQEAVSMRHKYIGVSSEFPADVVPDQYQTIQVIDGVYRVFRGSIYNCDNCTESVAVRECYQCSKENGTPVRMCTSCDQVMHKHPNKRNHHRQECSSGSPLYTPIQWTEFCADIMRLERIRLDGRVNSLSVKRLELLELKYDLHVLLNDFTERERLKKSRTDFDHIIKVDTHVHALSAPCAGHLLDFMKDKAANEGDKPCFYEGGHVLTLKQVFDKLNVPVETLTLDSLEMKAVNTFNRFDRFTNTYNPLGSSELRTVFLKKDNYIKGAYYAQLLGEVLKRTEERKFIKMELRISIYGRGRDEWSYLAQWLTSHDQLRLPCNRWVVQVPRLYHIFKKHGDVDNFQQFIDNIFAPLFEVTRDPSVDPLLAKILNENITGFDSVDEEVTGDDINMHSLSHTPTKWCDDKNPPYNMYMYYMYSNIHSLNRFRQSKGLSTFFFKPHCGVGGGRSHLSGAYLLSDGITHGIVLDKVPVMQYLWFMSQIPLSMSPLGEDAIYCSYEKNPFGLYFKRGLNVSLSTDAPLQLHSTAEPLIEEYSSAAKMWKLSICDLSELSRNSVVQSSFSKEQKELWLGPSGVVGEGETCIEANKKGNDVNLSNVPDTRLMFRNHTHTHEMHMVNTVSSLRTRKPEEIRKVSSQFAKENAEYEQAFMEKTAPKQNGHRQVKDEVVEKTKGENIFFAVTAGAAAGFFLSSVLRSRN